MHYFDPASFSDTFFRIDSFATQTVWNGYKKLELRKPYNAAARACPSVDPTSPSTLSFPYPSRSRFTRASENVSLVLYMV